MQLYDDRGDSAIQVFLNFGGKPAAERERQFEAVRAVRGEVSWSTIAGDYRSGAMSPAAGVQAG